MAEVFLLQAVFSLTALVLELPSGYFADRFGRGRSLLIAYIFWASAYLLYPWAKDIWFCLVCELLIGIAVSFESGADTALLYDSLKQTGREEEFAAKQGAVVLSGVIAETAAAVAGGVMAAYDLRLPFYATGVQLLIAALIASSLYEVRFDQNSISKKTISMPVLLQNKRLLCSIVLFALISTSTYISIWFYQPFWKVIGMPIALYGIAWAACSLSAGLSSWLCGKASLRLQSHLITLASFLPGLGLLGIAAIWSAPALVFCAVIQFSRGINSTLIIAEVHKHVPSELRASAHSLLSLALRILFLLAGPYLGFVADKVGLAAAIGLAAGLSLVLAGIARAALFWSKKS